MNEADFCSPLLHSKLESSDGDGGQEVGNNRTSVTVERIVAPVESLGAARETWLISCSQVIATTLG